MVGLAEGDLALHVAVGLLGAGCGNHAIAARLHLTEKTVRNNVSALLMKVGVRDRAALVAAARDAGLGAS